MPVHTHHRAHALEPEGVAKAAQQIVLAIIKQDIFHYGQAELCHTLGKPNGYKTAMQRKIGASGSFHANKVSKIYMEIETKRAIHICIAQYYWIEEFI